MLKTQKCVHDMMQALELDLPNEGSPGVENLNHLLYKSLVNEECGEFDTVMSCLWTLHGLKKGAKARAFILSTLSNDLDIPRAEINYFENLDDEDFIREMTRFLWAQAIDAMCDIIIVVHNTSNAMGIDIEPFIDEVHRTNMKKAGGPLRSDGKRLKPPGWQPPRIEEMLDDLLVEQHQGSVSERMIESFLEWREEADEEHLCDTFDLALGWFASRTSTHEEACWFAEVVRDLSD